LEQISITELSAHLSDHTKESVWRRIYPPFNHADIYTKRQRANEENTFLDFQKKDNGNSNKDNSAGKEGSKECFHSSVRQMVGTCALLF
jgi:hypothetical protein